MAVGLRLGHQAAADTAIFSRGIDVPTTLPFKINAKIFDQKKDSRELKKTSGSNLHVEGNEFSFLFSFFNFFPSSSQFIKNSIFLEGVHCVSLITNTTVLLTFFKKFNNSRNAYFDR